MTRQPRILCIEDNPVNWRLARRLLEQSGCEMHWAEEGFKGFEMALELKPDLILLDINLPGLSGFEIATKFRQTPEIANIPIVALTAKTQKIDRETALVAGCDGFIPKPIDPFTFAKQVEAYLGGLRERVDQAREGEVLRGFNAKMLEHLEMQLREAQEANRKLVAAQRELENRSQSLSRLLDMSRLLLAEHNPQILMFQVLEHVCNEMGTQHFAAYQLHPSGGYWEGFLRNGEAFDVAYTLPQHHPFCERLASLPSVGVMHGEALRMNRIWEEGQTLGFWESQKEAALLPLRAPKDDHEIRGFWTFTRELVRPFQPLELELMSLHASLAMVGLENAELIVNLHESTRALAASYERLEGAYQDVREAKAELSKQDRQHFMEALFLKITHRINAPVQHIHTHRDALERLSQTLTTTDPQGLAALQAVKGGMAKIESLLKGLMRRVNMDSPGIPEWLNLHDLIQQEVELIQAEGIVPEKAQVLLELAPQDPTLLGVYGDFSHLLSLLATHAFSGPRPSQVMFLRTWLEADKCHLEVRDEGSPLPEALLPHVLEPFPSLHQEMGGNTRSSGDTLLLAKKIVNTYGGDLEVHNTEKGTLVHAFVRMT